MLQYEHLGVYVVDDCGLLYGVLHDAYAEGYGVLVLEHCGKRYGVVV